MVVSKRSKKLAQETERASNPPPERTEYSPYRDRINAVAVSALFVVLCGVYAVFFYRVPIRTRTSVSLSAAGVLSGPGRVGSAMVRSARR